MKNLGAILAVALVAFSFVGASAPANKENPFHVDAMRINAEITGFDLDLSEAQLMGQQSFTLPTGALGVQAVMDIASGEFTVTPISAVPDSTGQSGCIIVNSFVGYGYAKDTSGGLPPIGDYNAGCTPNFANFYEHPGGIMSETLICLNAAQFCEVYGQGVTFLGAFSFEYMYVYCQFSTFSAVLGQAAPPPNAPITAISNGICYAYGFASNGFGVNPYYGFIYAYPPGPTTVVLGQIN